MSDKTIFERIVDREIPANIVYEDDTVIAFLDVNPNNKGHSLVVPKKVFRNALETPDDTLKHIFHVGKQLGRALMEGLGAQGINFIMNNEEAAGQVVFHTHLHVIPRFLGDGHIHWKQSSYGSDQEAAEIAEKIRQNLH